MAQEKARLTPAERTNLVAYIDGELDPAQARALDAKLSVSQTARTEIESLRKTWDLLDLLPTPRVRQDFGTRTLTLISQELIQRGRQVERSRRWASRLVRLAVACSVALLTVLVGYSSARWAWPDPSARLIEQLSVAEHLDEYKQIETFEFLKQLDASPEFNDDGSD